MRRALPVIALSAAGLTWLLRAQGVIDDRSTAVARALVSPAASAPVAPGPSANESPTTVAPSRTSSTTDGPVVQTRWGPVQVGAVVRGGRLVDVKVLEYPNEAFRSERINAEALPLLHDQALAAQSAALDGVSGATYTTEGYVRSLQAALDTAGFRG